MGISKIDVSIVERLAPAAGPTSSADYNATLQETINSLSQISLSWNNDLQPLLDSLPSGGVNIIREDRTGEINPFANGFDGSQLYLDSTSTTITDDGKYFSESLNRPLSIKESIENVQVQLNNAIQELQVEISKVASNTGISTRQKQAIGSRIFDPETSSNENSLDGLAQKTSKNLTQVALDIAGSTSYLTNSGAQTLQYSILQQLETIKNAHDYNGVFNTLSHSHLNLHAHRYRIAPVGLLNGVNKTYYLPAGEEFIQGTLRVIINGIEKILTKEYVEHPNRKGFDLTPAHRALENDGLGSDDFLWIHYDVMA